MEERMMGDDGQDDGGEGVQQSDGFPPSLDNSFSSLTVRELKRFLSESGVDIIKEGLIERADLIQRAREVVLNTSCQYPSTLPSLSPVVREREGEARGVANIPEEERGEAAPRSELTSEQAEKILSFIAVTEADTEEARYILEAMAWDIDAAVGMYMESKTRSRVNNSGGTTSSLGTAAGIRTTIGDEESVDYSGGIPNTASSIFDSVTSEDTRDEGKSQPYLSNEVVQSMGGSSPPTFSYAGDDSTREESISSTRGNVAPSLAPSLTSDRYSNCGFDEEGIRAPLPSVRDTLISDGDFVGNLMASYGSYGSGDEEQEDSSVWMFPPPEGLSATTNFKDTKELCKSQERWLLINIQDPQIIASHNLNGDVWCDEVVQSIIQTSFVFWQRSSTSRQAGEFLRNYHIASDKLPHTSILDPRTGLMLLQIQGYVEKEDMCTMLVDFLEKNQVGQMKAPRLRTVSIGGAAANYTDPKQLAEEESKQGNKDEHRVNDEIDGDSLDEGNCSSSIDSQFVEEKKKTTTAEPSIEAVDVTRVQLKLPDGGKAIARRFLKTDSVEHLFEVARSLLPPEQQNRSFDITFDFPPRALLPLKSKTLSENNKKHNILTA